MNLIPKNNHLIVKEPDRETQTKEGIVIPEVGNRRDDEQVAQGEVIGAQKNVSEIVKVGDWVMFHKVLPIDVVIEDNKGKKMKVWFLKLEDVLAVIEK